MAQNINLLDPGLRQAKPRLTLSVLVNCVGGLVVALLVVYVFLHFQVHGLNSELRKTEAVLEAERAEAQKLAAQAAVRKPDPQLEAEIAKLQGELRQAQESLMALKGGSFGDRQGFAEYLRAFSRQSVDGLWLTGFTITGAGEVELSGRTLRPDLVPAYIQRLNSEEVLAGRTFARLEMSRPGSDAPPEKKAQVAPFLDFTLATREAVKTVEKTQ